jgi:chemotaxis protein methyltransferase WspC
MSGGYVNEVVREWIRGATGLHITDENAAPVELAIRLEAEQRRSSPEDLLVGVLSGRLPAQPLIDAITTNESYFFRAERQMALTAGELLPERLRREPGRAQRVLSIPCARGEEPYSIAILLREHGIPDSAVTLVGGDISARCLADAERGDYNALTLRRTDAGRAQRWFRVLEQRRVRLDPTILPRVRFHRVNLLTDSTAVIGGPFDIVFCQNLLIYFDGATIARALAALKLLLRPDGWLFVDHTEWSLPRGCFQMVERGGCVGFRPQGAGSSTPTARPRTPPARSGAVRAAAVEAVTPVHPPVDVSPPLLTRPTPAPVAPSQQTGLGATLDRLDAVLADAPHDPAALLGKARALANGGDEMQALECLETLLAAVDAGEMRVPTAERSEALALFAVLLRKKGLAGLAGGYLDELARLAPEHPALRLRGEADG